MYSDRMALLSGQKIPILGLGTWQSLPGKVTEAVIHAFKTGYRHIDCAHAYQNEAEVGEALQYAINELKIPRSEIFITSKLVWNIFHRDEDVESAIRVTLEKFGLDYVDLYLVHWPYGYIKTGDELFPLKEDGSCKVEESVNHVDVWHSMEKLAEKGLAKSIGVSNYNIKQLQDVLDKCKIKPVTNQVEVHPYFAQEELVNFCKSNGITITAYSPFSSPYRPWAKPDDPKIFEEPKLVGLAKKHGKTTAQVILRWHIQRDLIVIPKSVNPSRIEQNWNVFDFKLSDEDMKEILSLDVNKRFIFLERDSVHKDFPFKLD